MSNNKQDHIVEANKKVSSVEWLFEQIARRQGSILQTIPFYDDNQDLLQQAKAIEKEQIIEAYEQGSQTYYDLNLPINGDQYYNEI